MMHLNRRHAHGGNNNNEDDDDASPEPSPVQPPNPQQQPRHLSSSSPPRQSTGMSAFSSMPKWTPQSDDLQNHPYNDMIGEESSLPVLPDVPSPYSPPPSSLFSGEEFPAKSIRKKSQHSGGADPLSTGGGRSGGARRLSLQDVSLNANHLLFQHQQRVYSNNSNLENTLTSPPSAQNYNQSQGLPLVHRLKTDLQETNAKMHLLEQENKALSNECERFQREMRKWQQAQDNDSVKMEGLEQNIADLQQELLSCREQLRESKSNLEISEQEKQLITKDIEHLQEEHKNLQNALADATERDNKWLVEKDALQAEIGRLRQVNKTAATLASAREKQQTELQQEVERVRLELNESKQTCQTLRSKLQEARAKARGSNVSMASVAAAAPATVVPPPPQPNVFTFDTTATGSGIGGGASTAVDADDNKHGAWIFDRLGRIRDAVDRTTLVQEYRKEFTRMKLEHDAEVKSLTAQHEQDLRDVEDETKSKVTARVRDLRRRLQSDFDAKVSSLERQYQAEIARVQRECDQKTAVAQEAVQAAESEVLTIAEQLENEAAVREKLEGTVRDLERKLEIEHNQAQSKLSSDRQQWQAETKTLIATIQHGCNTVFEHNLNRAHAVSPQSVLTGVDGNDDASSPSPSSDLNDSGFPMDSDNHFAQKTPWLAKKKTSYQSPLDVSHALDETEAFVRSVVGN